NFGLLDLQLLQIRKRDFGLNLDLKGIRQAMFFLELDRIGIIKLRLADNLEGIFLDGLLITLADQGTADLFFDVVAEALFNELLRRMAGAEPRDGRILSQFLVLFGEL